MWTPKFLCKVTVSFFFLPSLRVAPPRRRLRLRCGVQIPIIAGPFSEQFPSSPIPLAFVTWFSDLNSLSPFFNSCFPLLNEPLFHGPGDYLPNYSSAPFPPFADMPLLISSRHSSPLPASPPSARFEDDQGNYYCRPVQCGSPQPTVIVGLCFFLLRFSPQFISVFSVVRLWDDGNSFKLEEFCPPFRSFYFLHFFFER